MGLRVQRTSWAMEACRPWGGWHSGTDGLWGALGPGCQAVVVRSHALLHGQEVRTFLPPVGSKAKVGP